MNSEFWLGKRVFITGHTGFKGSWLSICLAKLGAQIFGYSTAPPTNPNLFTVAHVPDCLINSTIADIRDFDSLNESLRSSAAQIVFHLAAQPLVTQSYLDPHETYSVNVTGTVNLFEAIRANPQVRSVVNVTTDKCYENNETIWPFRETEALGGFDPYSSSKACSEIITSAYTSSFFRGTSTNVATARAGNVIGGGDWATNRLIPDLFRSVDHDQPLLIRSPDAIRPWQHVLEPISGYITLAERLFSDGDQFSGPWNFGPNDISNRTVQWIVNYLSSKEPRLTYQFDKKSHPHEASVLKLDSTKARHYLGWYPRWSLEQSLEASLLWHQASHQNTNMYDFTSMQIDKYFQDDI